MNVFKKILISVFLLIPLASWANVAVCTIEINDINAGVKSKDQAKYTIEHTFTFKEGTNALTGMQRKHFNLPDGRYSCTLAFLDINTGTSLSCEKKVDYGQTYMQSDLSGFKVDKSENNLIFRDGESHFLLNAICASKA